MAYAEKEIFETAEEIFNDRQASLSWIYTPNNVLGFKRPSDLMNSAEGRDEVYELLMQIKHGVYS